MSLLPLSAYCQKAKDAELLGKAIEYFGGEKYHESMIVFENLKEKYKLNPRFEAYLGVCYFKEQDYEKAVKTLSKVIPALEPFPPHERALYYYSCAESHFMLENYDSAKVYFEKTIPVCRKEDQGNVYFRLGFCSLFKEDYDKAIDNFGLAYYWFGRLNRQNKESKARKKQTETMLRTLLITHRAGRMDMTDKETWNHKHQNADHEDTHVDQKE